MLKIALPFQQETCRQAAFRGRIEFPTVNPKYGGPQQPFLADFGLFSEYVNDAGLDIICGKLNFLERHPIFCEAPVIRFTDPLLVSYLTEFRSGPAVRHYFLQCGRWP